MKLPRERFIEQMIKFFENNEYFEQKTLGARRELVTKLFAYRDLMTEAEHKSDIRIRSNFISGFKITAEPIKKEAPKAAEKPAAQKLPIKK